MHDRLVSQRFDALHQCFLVIIIITIFYIEVPTPLEDIIAVEQSGVRTDRCKTKQRLSFLLIKVYPPEV